MAIVILAAACSKSKKDDPEPPSPVIGYWTGSYTTIGQLGSTNYAILIQPGGVARVYDLDNKSDTSQLVAAQKVNATWTLSGFTLQTTYKSGASKLVNTTATLNSSYTSMTGTWGSEGVTKGNISLNK